MNNKQDFLLSVLLLIGLMVSAGGVYAQLIYDTDICRGCHDGYKNIPSLIGKSSGEAHHLANLDYSEVLYSKCKTCHTVTTEYEKDCINCHASYRKIDRYGNGYPTPAIPFLLSMYLPDRHHRNVGTEIGDTGEIYKCFSCHAISFNSRGEPIGLRDWTDCGPDESAEPSVLPADFVCIKK